MDKFTQFTSIATVIIAVITCANYLLTRLTRIELKVETMWDFLFKRALSETVAKNLASINSPFRITSEGRKNFTGIENELKEFYLINKNLFDRNDKRMFIELQNKFGNRILNEIAIPNKMIYSDCMLIAMEISREINE